MSRTVSLPDGPLTWQDVIEHPSLQDLPFKIELNEWGQIVTSPASNQHSIYQGEILDRLRDLLPEGKGVPECSIETSKGTKVADVVWGSTGFFEAHRAETPFTMAPEICVEVISPSSTEAEIQEKVTLYLAKGAHEVWTCDLEGRVAFYGYEGRREASRVAPDFPSKI